MDEPKFGVIDMVYVVTVVCDNSVNPKVGGSDIEQSITSEMCLVSISILPNTSDGFAAINK